MAAARVEKSVVAWVAEAAVVAALDAAALVMIFCVAPKCRSAARAGVMATVFDICQTETLGERKLYF